MSDETLRRLLSLSVEKKLAFLALLYERMVPELRSFCIAEGRDYSVFQTFQQQLWHRLGNRRSSASWRELRDRMLQATPDSEDFGSPVASSALSAALVAIAIANFIDDNQDAHISAATGFALDSLDAIVIGELEVTVVDRAIDEYVNSHPLLDRERLREESDVALLTAMSETPSPSSVLSMLLNRAKTQGTLLSSE